jgi:hypothetical protein
MTVHVGVGNMAVCALVGKFGRLSAASAAEIIPRPAMKASSIVRSFICVVSWLRFWKEVYVDNVQR